jgi:hypothetical protein
VSGRRDLPIPEGWRPGRNMRVEVHPHEKFDPHPPAGVWRIVDRSPGSPGPHWWMQPHDDVARRWAERNPARIISGCVEVKGLLIVPPGTPVPARATTGKRPAGGRR